MHTKKSRSNLRRFLESIAAERHLAILSLLLGPEPASPSKQGLLCTRHCGLIFCSEYKFVCCILRNEHDLCAEDIGPGDGDCVTNVLRLSS